MHPVASFIHNKSMPMVICLCKSIRNDQAVNHRHNRTMLSHLICPTSSDSTSNNIHKCNLFNRNQIHHRQIRIWRIPHYHTNTKPIRPPLPHRLPAHPTTSSVRRTARVKPHLVNNWHQPKPRTTTTTTKIADRKRGGDCFLVEGKRIKRIKISPSTKKKRNV